jgi:hypothetical protein
MDVVDAGVADEGEVAGKVAAHEGVVPVELILNENHDTVVVSVLRQNYSIVRALLFNVFVIIFFLLILKTSIMYSIMTPTTVLQQWCKNHQKYS